MVWQGWRENFRKGNVGFFEPSEGMMEHIVSAEKEKA
jgi:hypothetical protein